MSSVKKQSRKMSTTYTWFWYIRLINKDGESYPNHSGWVVRIEREGVRGFNPDDPKVVEASWKQAIEDVAQNVDFSEDGVGQGWELTCSILEWNWGKVTNVAVLY